MNKIVIFGATSAMAMETAKIYAGQGKDLYLVGRNEQRLEEIKEDLLARGAGNVGLTTCELGDSETHHGLLSKINSDFSDFDGVLIAYGSLCNQEECEKNYSHALKEIEVNMLSVISLLTLIANQMEERGAGTIVVITSVAGDRGRKSNYVYGAAKGGLSIFLQGLRNRLFDKGVSVVTIKPGFVSTPMTAHLDQGPLFVKPDVIGRGIVSAVEKNRNIVYLPWFWIGIMAIIKSIPEMVFKRLSL